jgi:hypothetical protein
VQPLRGLDGARTKTALLGNTGSLTATVILLAERYNSATDHDSNGEHPASRSGSLRPFAVFGAAEALAASAQQAAKFEAWRGARALPVVLRGCREYLVTPPKPASDGTTTSQPTFGRKDGRLRACRSQSVRGDYGERYAPVRLQCGRRWRFHGGVGGAGRIIHGS